MSNDSVRTYYFPESGNGGNGGQYSFDPNLLFGAMLGGGGFGGFGGGANWLWPFLLFALWGNNGWGGFGGFGGNNGALGVDFLSNQLNNTAGRDLIMQAIQGNNSAIEKLASSLNCTAGEIRNAIGSLSTQICNLGNQVGMSSLQVIQAINAGNSDLQRQLADCCCKTQTAIQESNYLTERGFCNTNQILSKGFSDLGYASQAQTCELTQTANANTNAILAKLDAIEDSRKDRELAEKDRMIATLTARSERQAELQPIYNALNDIQCNQPEVKKISCPTQYVPVNNAINATYSLIPTCGYGFGYGVGYNGWNNGNCCGNSLWG